MRLIDADVLLQDIRENMPNYEVKEDFLLFVHAQPTAYNVEEVVEEVQNVRLPLASQKARIIGIIRKGGV